VPVQEIMSKYGVSQQQVQPLLDWLKAQHFDIVSVSPDNTSVEARSTAGNVAKALQVELVRVTNDGITYTSARNAPSLPENVAANVRAIGGLQPHRQAHKHARRLPASVRGAAEAVAPHGYTPNQILQAYGADGLPVTGKGQIIGIVIDTAPDPDDMAKFWQLAGVPIAPGQRIEVVNVNGGALPPPSGEETLDAQWSSGVAPGATIRIYATGSLRFTDIDKALDRILVDAATEPGLRQVSMSLGLGESYMAQGEVKTEHAKFVRLAAAGVNVFVSTGDAGSNPDSTGHSSGGPLQVEYESSDPCVIGVGGTTLQLDAHGNVVRETGWSSGGGGKSRFFPRPSWQSVNGITHSKSRLVPDVSLTADPNYGGMVVLNGSAMAYGGTSWSAPAWAGFCALINEARLTAGKPALPFLNPLLYKLQGAPCFRDITSGSNGAYEAVKGYDMVTGLGVPDVKALIANLPG
jgi:kumamolisin